MFFFAAHNSGCDVDGDWSFGVGKVKHARYPVSSSKSYGKQLASWIHGF